MEITEQTIWNHQIKNKQGNSNSHNGDLLMSDSQKKQSRFSDLIGRIYFIVPLIILASLPVVEYLVKGTLELSLPNILIVLASVMCLITWSMRIHSELSVLMPVVITAIASTALGMLMVSKTPELHMHAAATMMIMIIWLASAPKLKLYIIAISCALIITAISYMLFTANLSVQNLITVMSLLISGVMMGIFTQVHRFMHAHDNVPEDMLAGDLSHIEYDDDAEALFEEEHAADLEQDWPDVLKELNKSLGSIHDVDVLFNKMLVLMNDAVTYKTGAVGMMQERELKVTQTFGNEELAIPEVLDWTNDMVRALAERHQEMIHKFEYEDFQRGKIPICRLDLPVLSNDKFVGVVSLIREGEEFNTYERKLLTSIIFHSMVYLRNARMYEEFKRLKSKGKQTAIFTREQFMDASQQRLKKLNEPRSASLLIIEIDHFEKLLDRYGKEVALAVYNTLSDVIMASIRDQDLLGRYGNEGYVVLLNDTDLLDAKKLAERMRELISKAPCKTSVGKITTTVSIGLAAASHSDEDLVSLIQRAGMALFVAKESGKNTVKVKL